MLRVDFSKLSPSSETEAVAADRLAKWINTHPSVDYLDPERLSYDNQDLSIIVLADILHNLVSQGQLVIRYKVKSPYDHVLADHIFDEPYVSLNIYDQSENSFDSREGEFIPVFMEPELYE